MPYQIEHFHDGPEGIRRKLNQMVDICNALIQARGDDNILVEVQPGSGMSIRFLGALQLIPQFSEKFFIAPLICDGGSNGTPGVGATYLYSIYNLAGDKVLASKVPLFFRRAFAGPCAVAQRGLVYRAGVGFDPGFYNMVGNNPNSSSGSGSGADQPTGLRLLFADESFGTSVGVGTCT